MTNQALAQHWLVQVALGAGTECTAALDLEPHVPPAQAWIAVARHCGIGPDELAVQVAAHFRLDVADLRTAEPAARKLIAEQVARQYHVLPLRQTDRELVLATCDPSDIAAEQAVGFASSRTPVFAIAAPQAIQDGIDAAYATRQSEQLLGRVDAEIAEAVRVVEDLRPERVSHEEAETAPVVKLTNLILRDATSSHASDIHIEPGRESGVVRFRVDGMLRDYMELPVAALNRIVSRIKILGKLNIADRVRPQDGKSRVEIDDRTYELRISTVPTGGSEKAVIRILDPDVTHSLEELGVPQLEYERLGRLLSYRDGIVVVTGPTGSGKTTTLYAALQRIATRDVNVMTVEDPIEYELPGITQIQVQAKQDVTFASALRAILRQDPDVILIGEVRDFETASVATQASMTGHLVLATLHTNDATSVVPRLVEIGLDRASVAASLRGIIAQRLVRGVCTDCAVPVDGALTPEEERLARIYGAPPTMRAVGCDACGRSGYRGRLPVQEVLTVTPDLAEMIARGASAVELQRAAAGGMRLMRETALERLEAGETTLQEIDRVLGEVAAAAAPTSSPAPTEQRVLVVDDDAVSRGLARTLLEANGFVVDEAENGEAALAALAVDARYALVVLDLDMPVLDGRGALGRIRDDHRTASVPVIVLTGSDDAGAEIDLMEAGADDYIRKPIDPPRFAARVKATLRRARG